MAGSAGAQPAAVGAWSSSAPGRKSIARRTRAGAPAAIVPGGRSVVTTLLAPTTQRSPIVTPLVTTTWAPQPDVVPHARRPLRREALPGDRAARVVEAVVRVADEAAVGQHAVRRRSRRGRRRRPSPPGSGRSPSPMRSRASPGTVIHTSGSKSTCGPSSMRPSSSPSRTLPCSGMRAKHSRSASSQCRRARFQGSESARTTPLLQPEAGLGGGHGAGTEVIAGPSFPRRRPCTAPCSTQGPCSAT